MISRQEALDFAADLGLTPQVVEKDYVLGWLLAGIGQHSEIGRQWLFKGGTCLKKCFFETYRFSEDLDFTVPDAAHLDEAFLTRVFGEIAGWLYEQAGIEIPTETPRFELYRNPRGMISVQGRVGYRGPLGRVGSVPRIKLDLSNDERVVLEADHREVHHPYSDRPANGIRVQTYRFEEVFAEKTRALAERLRPRDLYDVVHLYRRQDLEPDLSIVADVLRQKCEFKGIPLPTKDSLNAHPELAALRADWATMLAHQLPALPPFEEFWDELPQVFAWLYAAAKRAPASFIPSMALRGETVNESWHAPAMATSWRREGVTAPLELIRFAAANHLCVDLRYRDEQGKVGSRLIEPYALRRTNSGALLLHAIRHDDGQSRTYRVDRILGAHATPKRFVPQYAIELSAAGTLDAQRSERTSPRTMVPPPRRSTLVPSRPFATDLTYVYECVHCRKRFKRKAQDSRLNPHKNKSGWPCPGQTGMLIDTL